MNDHSAGQLTSITNVYSFPSSINCTLLSLIYIHVLHASKSKCKMFYICYIIINYLLKISINDPNTMFFFIMKNESSFHRSSAVIIVRISRVGQLVFPIIRTFLLGFWYIEVLKTSDDFIPGFSNWTIFFMFEFSLKIYSQNQSKKSMVI